MSDLGEFLRSRRAALSPAELGFEAGSARRRVPGLRREELALAAGISVDYYVRLEQGRTRNVSDAVWESVAEALRLDADERAYLHSLARPRRGRPNRPASQSVRPGLLRLLAGLRHVPALVLGHRTDILAWNDRAAATLTDFAALRAEERNFARLVFLPHHTGSGVRFDPASAQEVVGVLRAYAARHPDDPRSVELTGELARHSGHFAHLWSSRTVRRSLHGPRTVHHPGAEPTALLLETLTLPDDPEQLLLTYTLPEDTPAARQEGSEMPTATPRDQDLESACRPRLLLAGEEDDDEPEGGANPNIVRGID